MENNDKNITTTRYALNTVSYILYFDTY